MSVCEEFLAEWARLDSAGALAAVEEFVKLRSLASRSQPARPVGKLIAAALPDEERERIWRQLLEAENSAVNWDLRHGFVLYYLGLDPQDGAARFDEIPPNRRGVVSMSEVGEALAAVNPSLLPAWLESRSPAERQMLDPTGMALASRLGRYFRETGDLAGVLAVFPELPEAVQQQTAPRLITASRAEDLLESLNQWQKILPDLSSGEGDALSAAVFATHVERGGGAVVRALDPGDLSQAELNAVTVAYANAAPRSALEWAHSLPRELATEAVATVITHWSRVEPVGAARVIQELEPGAHRERARQVLEKRIEDEGDERLRQLVPGILGGSPGS